MNNYINKKIDIQINDIIHHLEALDFNSPEAREVVRITLLQCREDVIQEIKIKNASEIEKANEYMKNIREDTLREVGKIIEKHDPSTNRKTGKTYWGNTLRDEIKSLLDNKEDNE